MPHDLSEAPAMSADPEIRTALVARVKRQLKLGIYDEETRIDALLDRLAGELLASDDDAEAEAA